MRTMDAIEIAEFMEENHTGVLSLADGGDGYGIPLSFAYDEEGPYVYLRLGIGPDSQKRRFLDATEHVSFVVYDHTDEGWKSVIAGGPLEELSEDDLDSTIIETLRNLDIPYFSVHDRRSGKPEFTLARIDVDELSGIVETPG